MPRPKSELTKSGKTIGVRLTSSEYEEYVKLGKSKWVRKLLRESRDKVGKDDGTKQRTTAPKDIEPRRTAEVVAVPKSVWQVVGKATQAKPKESDS